MVRFDSLIARIALAVLLAVASGLGASRTAQGQTLTDPQANVVGSFDIDSSGALTINAFVSQARYLDGTGKLFNDAEETIIGAPVTLSGSTFVEVDLLGNFVYSGGTLSVGSGASLYLTATLTDATIQPTNAFLGTINPDVALNMTVTSTNTTLGSRFISEFQSALDSVPTTSAAVRLELTITAAPVRERSLEPAVSRPAGRRAGRALLQR